MTEHLPVQVLMEDTFNRPRTVLATRSPTSEDHIPLCGAGGRVPATGGMDAGTPWSVIVHGAEVDSQVAASSEVISVVASLTAVGGAGVADKGAVYYGARARGDLSTPAVVASGDACAWLIGLGFDGTDYEQLAQISMEVDGTPGDDDMPGRIVFWVTPDGGFEPAEAMRISSTKAVTFAGAVNFPAAAVANAALAVPAVRVLTETVTAASLVDGGGASGTKVLAISVPVGAILLGSKVVPSAGFIGDGSAALTIGDGTDVDRYNTGTIDIFATAANGVESGAPSGAKLITTANTPTVTVTSDSDITPVLAGGGSMDVSIYYIATV